MFFEQESLAFTILDVWELDQMHTDGENKNRNYHALSLRYCSDAVLTTKKQSCHLGDGSLCYVPANVNYRRTATHDKLIVIHFALYNYFSAEIETFTPADFRPYRALFERALDIWTSSDPAYQNRTAAVFYQILAEIYAECKPRPTVSDPPLLCRAVTYLHQHLQDPNLSVTAIARHVNVSEVYLRKLFHKHRGTSPKKYILDERIRYAASLINTGYYTIAEVASLSGFHDSKYFSMLFKKIIGVSPSGYRYNFPEHAPSHAPLISASP